MTSRQFRSVLITGHGFENGSNWRWLAQPQSVDSIAGLVFADVGMSLESGPATRDIMAGQVVFLHPHRPARLESAARGTATCVWVPWVSVAEVESRLGALESMMAPTPLTVGLQAFLASLLAQQELPTPYTDYLVERIMVEMVFGALLESVPKKLAGAPESSALAHARSLMLMRRAETGFGVEELARAMQMSTRQVQRVFAAADSQPGDELRGMRVDLVQELLGDPECDPLSIGEIATRAGFTTAAALRRAMASRGLPLPKRARRSKSLSV